MRAIAVWWCEECEDVRPREFGSPHELHPAVGVGSCSGAVHEVLAGIKPETLIEALQQRVDAAFEANDREWFQPVIGPKKKKSASDRTGDCIRLAEAVAALVLARGSSAREEMANAASRARRQLQAVRG